MVSHPLSMREALGSIPSVSIILCSRSVQIQWRCAALFHGTCTRLTPVGFEPTPLRTGALSQRRRPLGQRVLIDVHFLFRKSVAVVADAQFQGGAVFDKRRPPSNKHPSPPAHVPALATPHPTIPRPTWTSARNAWHGQLLRVRHQIFQCLDHARMRHAWFCAPCQNPVAVCPAQSALSRRRKSPS